MNSSDLRKKFLDFFEKHGHKIVLSSSLLPNDPSVLFTTAGMQQFKPYYLGKNLRGVTMLLRAKNASGHLILKKWATSAI